VQGNADSTMSCEQERANWDGFMEKLEGGREERLKDKLPREKSAPS